MVWGCWILGCGKAGFQEPAPRGPIPVQAAPDDPSEAPDSPGQVPEGHPSQETPSGKAFRPTFYQPLGGSLTLPGRTTYRFRVPVARAGTRLRFVFRAGDAPLRLHEATVARAETKGALASAPLALTFSGAPGAHAAAWESLRSDPVLLQVDFREELAVSFEVEGAVATSARALFPHGARAPGGFSRKREGFGTSQTELVGLSAIEVEAEPGRCVAVVGVGTRAGSGEGDLRETWPAVAERLLGIPVLDLGGLEGAEAARSLESLRACGQVACVVLPEAEAVDGASAESLEASLSRTFERLRPVCDVHAGLLPASSRRPGPRGAVNTWWRTQLPAERLIDFSTGLPDAEAPDAAARMGHAVASRLAGARAPESTAPFSLRETYRDSTHEILAVDPSGTVYALEERQGSSKLYASTDNARTWTRRGVHPDGFGFYKMASLRDGTLLANVVSPGGHALSRSTDHGVTWTVVLPLDRFKMLQPHNIQELHGTVFFLEYQTFTEESPINLWVSQDGGVTWRVRYVFEGRRHGHGLVADPVQGVLWAMMGDVKGGLLRSEDEGMTWRPVVEGPPGVAVDAVVTPKGLLFGTDNLFAPPLPGVQRVGGDDVMVRLTQLPGPSYSILEVPGGGYVMGTTRETGGDVYAPDDFSAHVLYSADGETWTEFRAFPRATDNDYARADVYWALPSGEIILTLSNTQELGWRRGFMLLEAVRHGMRSR
ncbi:hypothetical protein [Melittangium boletus]|uniref:Uncharacterized protein n=1 Tax=Melittangium boletus DSM 14713 TaxID=1294270 RepID=A0A250IDH9_9BACT|nr:hypothetical protein [Melittangium boletus]ATB29201.1 hypothetical protein MEBOL_002650 [Melittangium boletus DSM 14713]